MLLTEALLTGAFIGAVLGFVGAGGAMLAIPTLVYFFNFSQYQASRAALMVAFFASLSALIPKLRARDVLIKEALIIWSIGLFANVGGTIISASLPDKIVAVGYSAILLLSAILLSIKLPKPTSLVPTFWLVFLLAVSLGLLTGIFGVGGGFLAIPTFILFFNISQNKAAGTSLLIILLNSFTSLSLNIFDWPSFNLFIPIVISITAIIVAGFSSRLSNRFSDNAIRISFSFLLLILCFFNSYQVFIVDRF